ncbi:MAG: hypothetical protein GX803_02635 [Lentisphaerae bacterium]|jgi:hypothetical protein|nr:hypothetical protein [Lentisphaerota bacterium]
MEPIFIIVGGFIALAVVTRLIAGSYDRGRIERYIRERGWELVDRSWDPFGPGWFGEKDSRIYQIVYRDQQGNLHRAHVKTSMFSGVYLTNDRMIQATDHPPSTREDALFEENRRLRQRIAELEQEREV